MIGRSLSHYEILDQLGTGGMGEVYRARDTRLGREVALKVLPDEFAGDAERLSRFQREATLLASLNHPNIATLHGLERANGVHFLVMELVEGEDLATRLAGGALSIGEAKSVCSQVAASLDAAHQKGIIHRDLKPGNIRITPDGTVKVLDFGLAKAFTEQTESSDLSKSPTILSSGQTVAGVILGTAAYMSPEQARGKPLDKRTDVWSFGCVLYECLTGDVAFPGETVTDTLAKILERDPDWARLPSSTSPELRYLLSHCLAKDPQARWRDMGDVAIMMNRAGEEPENDVAAKTRRSGLARWWFGGALLLAIAAVSLWVSRAISPTDSSRTPAAVSIPQLSFTQLTVQGGVESYASLSPDGNFVIYQASPRGNSDIFLQRVGGYKPINLTENSPDDDGLPMFSPDGQQIAFRSDRQGGGIFVMGSTGESVRRVSDIGSHPDWSPDGKRLVVATEAFVTPLGRTGRSELWTIDLGSGEKSMLYAGDAVQPRWSPNGHRIAFWKVEDATGGRRDIWTIRSDGSAAVPVTQDAPVDWSPVWSADGRHLYFSSDRGGSMNIWRVPIDEETGEVLGDPEALTAPTAQVGAIGVSRDGRHIVYTNVVFRSNVARIEFDASTGTVGTRSLVTRGSIPAVEPRVSPSGEWVAFGSAGRQEDIYLVHTDGTETRKLTDDLHRDRGPNWSWDGRRVIFYSDRSGRYEVWSIKIDGSGLQQLTETTGPPAWFPSLSPDGTRLMGMNELGTHIVDLKQVPARLDEATLVSAPLEESDGIFRGAAWTADGGGLIGSAWSEDGRQIPGVYLYSLETRRYTRFLESVTPQSVGVTGLHDNRRVIVLAGATLTLLDTVTGEAKVLIEGDFEGVGSGTVSVPQDDSLIYLATGGSEGDVWLATME